MGAQTPIPDQGTGTLTPTGGVTPGKVTRLTDAFVDFALVIKGSRASGPALRHFPVLPVSFSPRLPGHGAHFC